MFIEFHEQLPHYFGETVPGSAREECGSRHSTLTTSKKLNRLKTDNSSRVHKGRGHKATAPKMSHCLEQRCWGGKTWAVVDDVLEAQCRPA